MLDGQVRFVVSENSDFGSRGHAFVRFDGRQISLSIATLNGVFAIAELSEFSEAGFVRFRRFLAFFGLVFCHFFSSADRVHRTPV